jgi:3D (Asp-Asp-Asp) domain-containing protein
MMRLFWKGNNVTEFVKEFTWSGSDTQASRTLEFSMLHSDYDDKIKKIEIKLGDVFTLYEDKDILFYGRITSRERTAESGSIHYIAMDYMHFLLRSTGTYEFENKKAEQIAKVVCADVGVEIEKLAATKSNIPALFFNNRPLYEVIMAGYTKAAQKNGKKYMPVMAGRRFSVIEKGAEIKDFWLNQGERIIDSTYGETTDSMVNRVAIYNTDGKKIGEVKEDSDLKTYGVYQSSLAVDSGDGKAEAKNLLSGIEKTASLNCLGDTRCTAGKGVRIRDNLSGIVGKFWIQNDTHTWAEDGTYTMSLQLAFKNIMETFEPDEKPQEQDYGANTATPGNRILNGQKVRAKFTAYYPANNPMEGGYYDAYDVLLSDWTKQGVKVIAAPPSVPKDTIIQVLETGTVQDGAEYRVRDRGEAIRIESGNVYHFDLLMSSAAECNTWGVKMGYAIIGNGTGYTTTGTAATNSSGNNIADAILNVARQYIGYKETGDNLNIFGEHYGYNGVAWCCIFCWDVYRMAGYQSLFMGGAKCAHCFTLMNWYAERGKTGSTPRPGALAIFWGSSNMGHIGIVESVQSPTSFTCIEGNAGSHADGVYRINRSTQSGFRTFCYPF